MRKFLGALAAAAGLGSCAASPAFAQPQRVTLAQAVAIAAAQSPVLQAARDDYRIAQLNVDFERTPLAPNVAGVLTVQRSQTAFGGTSSSTDLRGELQQLVFDGGRVLARIRSAQFSQDAAAGTYRRSAQLLTFTVAQAYYGALEACATVQLARQIVKQDQTQEALIRAQIQAGTRLAARSGDGASAHGAGARAACARARTGERHPSDVRQRPRPARRRRS